MMTATTLTKEHPILFSGPMIRAIMDRKKTETRRVVKPQPIRQHHIGWIRRLATHDWAVMTYYASVVEWIDCPYGKVGQKLWVREKFQWVWATDEKPPSKDKPEGWKIGYPATDGIQEYHDGGEGRILQRCAPSIHMPRWASRITLEIVDVRCQRLQEIKEDDAVREGVDAVSQDDVPRQASWTRRQDFAQLWDRLNGKRGFGWKVNPVVWVIEFKKVDG